MLRDPTWSKGMGIRGDSAPAYAYAINRPLSLADPDGLKVVINATSNQRFRDAVEELKKTPCGKKLFDALEKSGITFVIGNGEVAQTGAGIRQGETRAVKGTFGPDGTGMALITVDWSKLDERNAQFAKGKTFVGEPGIVLSDVFPIGHEFGHAIDLLVSRDQFNQGTEAEKNEIARLIQQFKDCKCQ